MESKMLTKTEESLFTELSHKELALDIILSQDQKKSLLRKRPSQL